MKKIFTCIILFVFICASVLSAYPDRFFESLAQSDDAKQTTEERSKTTMPVPMVSDYLYQSATRKCTGFIRR